MIRLFAAALCATFVLTSAACAQDRVRLGYGRLITNDFVGDGYDRWQSGSYASSRVWGPEWSGAAGTRLGDILEFRLNAQIAAPDDLNSPAAGDRPYAGAVSLGLHTHAMRGMTELAIGADMVVTGPVTGLARFQDTLHDALGVPGTSAGTRAAQIGNGVHPTLVIEAGRTFNLGNTRLRPFVEGRLGAETLLRAGADLTIGRIGEGELWVRDAISGQRYRTIQRQTVGYSFVLGADIARVASSIFLPSSQGYSLTDTRSRVRAGVHWQGKKNSGFYGLTWLGEEFVGQGGGQVVGSLRLNIDF